MPTGQLGWASWPPLAPIAEALSPAVRDVQAASAYVGRAWAGVLSSYDFPLTSAGYVEMRAAQRMREGAGSHLYSSLSSCDS